MTTTLVFDVETTGLPSKFLNKYPYITQLSFIIYDETTQNIKRIFNSYIAIPEHIRISYRITEITGITNEKCAKEGISIVDALKIFYQEYCNADNIVAHNIQFDKNLILAEFLRNRGDIKHDCPLWQYLFRPELTNGRQKLYCTMKEGKPLCKIFIQGRFGPFMKNPKLSELHKFLFPGDGEDPKKLHDSLIDTLLCLRCFIFMTTGRDIADSANSSNDETTRFTRLRNHIGF
jgi:DNA polymerase III epsilon subunit-like protein